MPLIGGHGRAFGITHVKYVTAGSIGIKGVLERVSSDGNGRPGEHAVHSPIMCVNACEETSTKRFPTGSLPALTRVSLIRLIQ